VLDASALMAVLRVKLGGEIVGRHLAGAIMSAVNLGEVATKLIDDGMLMSFQIDIRTFDDDQAFLAARLSARTRSRGLSLRDRACLALAHSLGATALTADRAWAGLGTGATHPVTGEHRAGPPATHPGRHQLRYGARFVRRNIDPRKKNTPTCQKPTEST
jgi:PIN domain nuclease of toxin-antitoxin system